MSTEEATLSIAQAITNLTRIVGSGKQQSPAVQAALQNLNQITRAVYTLQQTLAELLADEVTLDADVTVNGTATVNGDATVERLRLKDQSGAGSFLATLRVPETLSANRLVDLVLGDANRSLVGADFQSFTPLIAPASPGDFDPGYTNQDGFAVKLGPLPGTTNSLVWVSIGLAFTPTIGTGTGDLEITGHPWSIRSVGGLVGFAGPVSAMAGNWTWPTSATSVSLLPRASGDDVIKIVGMGDGGVTTNFDETNLTDASGHRVEGHVLYLTDD